MAGSLIVGDSYCIKISFLPPRIGVVVLAMALWSYQSTSFGAQCTIVNGPTLLLSAKNIENSLSRNFQDEAMPRPPMDRTAERGVRVGISSFTRWLDENPALFHEQEDQSPMATKAEGLNDVI